MTLSVIVSLFLMSNRPARAQDAAPDFSDQGLERRVQFLDSVFSVLQNQLQDDYDDEQDFDASQVSDRLAFEKRLIEQRKTFLESLKQVPYSKRQAALAQFIRAQVQQRQDFVKQQDAKRRAFDSQENRRKRRRDRDNIDDYDNA